MSKFTSFTQPDFSASHTITCSALRAHFHSAYVIGYLFSGHYRCEINRCHREEFHPGDLILLNPGEVHEDFPTPEEREYVMVAIQEQFLTLAVPEMKLLRPRFISPRNSADERTRRLFERLRQVIHSLTADKESVIRKAVFELTHSILPKLAAGNAEVDRPEIRNSAAHHEVIEAIRILEDTYAEKFDLDTLAQIVGLSKYYLEKVFKREVGLSPYQYILQLKVEKAKKLLTATSKSMVDISMELGFFDQSHFCNHFKRFTGVSPFSYRVASRSRFIPARSRHRPCKASPSQQLIGVFQDLRQA